MRRHSLSVLLICCNEADRIETCLQSISNWADQLIVFDSGSTDGTQDIVRRYTSELHETDWPGFGPQRQRALDKAWGDFVLTVDADERVTPELRSEIDYLLSKEEVECSVYHIRWSQFFLGKEIKNGRYSSAQRRFFRRQGAQYPTAQIHEKLMPAPGKMGQLKGRLLHDSFRDYQHVMLKHDKYAWLLAQEKYSRGERSSLLYAHLRAKWEFVHQYFFRGLVLDGARGYLQAVVLSHHAFNKYAGLWSLKEAQAIPDKIFSPSHRLRRPER